ISTRLLHLRWIIITFWIIIAIVAFPYAANVTHNLSAGGFENPNSASMWAMNRVEKLSPHSHTVPWLITGLPNNQLQAILHQKPGKSSALHPLTKEASVYIPPQNATSPSAQTAQKIRRAGGHITDVDTASVQHTLTQYARTTLALGSKIILPILAVLLLLVFRSFASALLPLVVATVGSDIALAAIDLLENHMSLSIYLTDSVSFLGLGVGVDYALFIATRFRRNMRKEMSREDAVIEAMQHSGRSVFYSGITVSMAIFMLAFGGSAYWRGLAIGGALAVLCVLLVTETLLPPLLYLLGRHIEWGSFVYGRFYKSFWPHLGRLVARRPLWLFSIGFILLALPSLLSPLFEMQAPANMSLLLPQSNLLRQSMKIEQKVRGADSIAPIAVVMQFKSPVTTSTPWEEMARVISAVSHDHDISHILSPLTPSTSPQMLARIASQPHSSAYAALSSFTNATKHPHTIAFYIQAKQGPDALSTEHLVQKLTQQVPTLVPATTRVGIGGQTAVFAGFNQQIAHRLPWIMASVIIISLVIMILATGSIVQSLLGMFFDAFVAVATTGVLVFIVQDGRFGMDAMPLNSAITPLIFVLLFGLSMDYEIILLHRIQELLKKGHVSRKAAREGIASTGRMITGAGLIMVAVFLSLLISPMEIIRTLSIGLSVAILFDTWIVRTLLVPTSIALMGRWAYWPWRTQSPSYPLSRNPSPALLPPVEQEEASSHSRKFL
ncbi:MAG: MMPL family transporter, partial [Firmicutes bacterium]|nr:MMPL family transporter [Bacillota bacterium]